MIKFREQLNNTTQTNERGDIKLYLSNLAEFDVKNPKIRMFSIVKLKQGEEISFHIHEGEGEYYYIISGEGVYTDNEEKFDVSPGTVTFTLSGNGHGMKNTGKEMLEFIALIIRD